MGLFGLGKKQKQEAVQGKLEALLDGTRWTREWVV